MSYSGYKSSPRGSRGGYRGGGYRGSRGGEGGSWRGSSRGYAGSSRGSGRGGRFSSSSGGGKWDRDDSGSYDSRSRYSGGGGDRYSSHSRDDSSYRSYRGDDNVSFSSRDHSHRGASPDRKRMRSDYSPASSMQRSHDYSDGMDYSSRSYGSYEGKRMSGYGGGEDRRVSSFREERERIRSDDYHFRKPLSISGPRHSTPRGSSFRGRSSFSRGLRSSFRRYEPSRAEPFLRKRSAVGSYGIRKPMGRTQEYLRRLKLYRIQRLRRLRERVEKEGSGDDDDDDEEGEEEEIEEEEEVEEEVTDEETEGQDKEDDEKTKKDTENEDEEMEVSGEEKKDDEEKKKKKVKKMVKVIKKIKRKIPKKKDDEKDKEEGGENKDIQVTVKQDSEGRDVDAVRKNYLGQPFIKLECPHCHTNCETFKDYMLHLYKSKHKIAMGGVTARVSKALAKLRMEQRAEQKDIDEEAKLKNMNMRTFFCLTCKLNYRSLKAEHLRSEKHKEIKNFLSPYCKICRIIYKSPMQYENHICSLFHLKRKYFYDKKNAENVDGSEIDMDKFMVLDQVGSGEDDDEESESDEKEARDENVAEKQEKEGEEEAGEEGAEKTKEKKVKKKKKQINLGSEYCKKINIYFCELCKTFLPRIEDQEQALAVHCRGSMHLRWYVKKKDDLALRKRAERIHRMREAQRKAESKEEDKEEPMDEDATEEVQTKKEPEVNKNTKPENMDEKVWGEVNQDLGELLKDVDEPRKVEDSDDDDDTRTAGRRYDRFKHSEKTKAGAVGEGEKKSADEKMVKGGVVNGGEDKDS